MNRREFLDLLRYYLRSYPGNIVNDIIADYEEHFRIGLEHGKSEAEIASELGSPKDIADEFLSHEIPLRPNANPTPPMGGAPGQMPFTQPAKKPTSIWLVLLIIAAVILLSPPVLGIILSLFVAMVALLAGLFATVLALGVSGFLSLFSWMVPSKAIVTVMGMTLHPVTSVFLGIFLICLAILICYLTVMLFLVCLKGIKNLYLSIRWNLARRRGQ